MKKLLSILLVLMMLIPGAWALAEADDGDVSITIFHTNDVHGRYDYTTGMGYAMAASYINEARGAGENVLVLDAGDVLHGTIFATATKGSSIVKLLNAIGYTAMAPGNHDFNYGKDRLLELSKEAEFPMLSSNITAEDGSPLLTPYTIVEVAEKKIAIVGAQNPEMVTAIHPDHIEGLTFGSIDEVAKVVAEVKDQSDAVIVLAHWGAGEAYLPDSSALAQIDGVDLVIDGHSHTLLPDIVQVENGAPVASTGEYLNNLGRVVMTFTADGLEIEPSLIPNPKLFEDHKLLSTVAGIESEQAAVLETVIGTAEVELVGERAIVRTQESNLGNYTCDTLIKMTDADVALFNGGGIRKTIAAGDITIRDVNEVFPFGNYVVVINISGADILAALEHGYRLLPDQNGGFPQIGGMTVEVDPSKAPGERVADLKIKGEPADPEKIYSMVTNDFLAAGGDGYEMLKGQPMLLQMSVMDDMLVTEIEAAKSITAAVDGRIKIIE